MLFLQGYLLAQPHFVEGEKVELAFPELLLYSLLLWDGGRAVLDYLCIYLPGWVAEETLAS